MMSTQPIDIIINVYHHGDILSEFKYVHVHSWLTVISLWQTDIAEKSPCGFERWLHHSLAGTWLHEEIKN